MPAKKKTIVSEMIKEYCVKPYKKEKEKAIEKGNLSKAIDASIKETACKISENHNKEIIPKKTKSKKERIKF